MDDDDTMDMVFEQLSANRAETVEAYEAELKRQQAAETLTSEIWERRRARIINEIEDFAASRTLAILMACRDAGKMRLAPRYVRSGKSALVVEYELARAAGRIH
jgi:hypothetical protein